MVILKLWPIFIFGAHKAPKLGSEGPQFSHLPISVQICMVRYIIYIQYHDGDFKFFVNFFFSTPWDPLQGLKGENPKEISVLKHSP